MEHDSTMRGALASRAPPTLHDALFVDKDNGRRRREDPIVATRGLLAAKNLQICVSQGRQRGATWAPDR